jgi:hypothetical protein
MPLSPHRYDGAASPVDWRLRDHIAARSLIALHMPINPAKIKTLMNWIH